jgi:outer membrane protein assembly factor BamB
MPFDRAYHTVIGDGRVFFGSSSDGAVYALSLDSGQPLWSFDTEGPIRFAPLLWHDSVLAASDDGCLYALRAADGKLLWKHRAGPDQSLTLGNGRMISKWPARGGPVMVDDTVYYAAGVWPSDGIFLYALDAQTGKPVWKNDDSGGIYMAQPHGGANAKSGASAQGYLVASGPQLLVPSGRAVPAAFDRQSGKFLYFHLQKYGQNGGTPTMAVGEIFFNGGLSFNSNSGVKLARVGTGSLAATADGLVRAAGDTVTAYRWVGKEIPDRRGKPVAGRSLEQLWQVETAAPAVSVIVAGGAVVVGGETGVEVIDMAEKGTVWSAETAGAAYGLAVSDGRLLVSTDQGQLYCFDSQGREAASTTDDKLAGSPYPPDSLAARAAADIINRTGLQEGFCLDLGCGDGALAYEMAKRTKLQIYAVESDAKKVASARAKLRQAGVYGSQVMVLHRPPGKTGLPRYFADLIVSARSLTQGADDALATTAQRCQRPYGGRVCTGRPGEMKVNVRGTLPGAGSWTHQYAGPGNSLCSDDTLVSGGLTMLWYRDVDFDVPQRHGRAPAPLFSGGILYHEGLDGLVAVDAYNGREIWRYEIPKLLAAYDGDQLMGTAGTGGNLCIANDRVYVRHEEKCLQLDAATGRLLREFHVSSADEKPAKWGYVAAVGDTLFGSEANPAHVVTYRYVERGGDMRKLLTESKSLFAMDATTGKLKWKYTAMDSIRHNAIAVARGKVFVIDRPAAVFDREKRPKQRQHPEGKLLALDAATGEILWTSRHPAYGTTLAASEKHGVLLMSYQPTRFRLDSEVGGRMSAFSADVGDRLWDVKADYTSRLILNDYTIYAQNGAWDLLTGKVQPFDFKRSYGCGVLAAGANMLVFRSATLGYYNLKGERRTENYGGMRPGCWVNAIPAGGLVLVPDASAGCRCSYLNQTWLALEPVAK